ncbi:MAG TPA: glycosyltransferase family 2 protein [Anaerolineae bacterium]|mgnify:FL=1|nr:glycosyltransferase family 2 protein [Anaerolineae bacterium]HOQ99513.1 glycosyltransferase family 2 protein [Anaerolineae bacterium]
MPDGAAWPRVCIVTPSYNQAEFIEETIRSVLLQRYPALEYIVIDGGSNDGSVEIIKKYERWLHYWASEPDGGQAHAIDKGWSRGSGQILAYLNSDDTYLVGSVAAAVQALASSPLAPAVCGSELLIDREGIVIAERPVKSAGLKELRRLGYISQPTVFLRRSCLEHVGGLDLTYHMVFDYELWTRLAQCGDFCCVPQVLATTRWHPHTKTQSQRPLIARELERTINGILSSTDGPAIGRIERRVIRARLDYELLSIYLDDPTHNGGLVVRHALHAAIAWPPMILWVVRLLASGLTAGRIGPAGASARHRPKGPQAAGQDKSKVLWSEWRPQQAAPSAATRRQ